MINDNFPKSKILVIQIPCYNESETLSKTLSELPKNLPGIDRIITLIIDDGSTDDTIQVALQNKVDYVIRLQKNHGLAKAFMVGVQFALSLGADVILNTDADNQYPSKYISELVKPIVENQAEVVIGNRNPGKNRHFSVIKRFLEMFGSFVLRKLLRFDIPDAPSGFRAFSRYAALRLNVFNSYSYTLETLILAANENINIKHIEIETNPNYRPSRLHRGNLNFIWRQTGVIIRSYVLYRPLKTFIGLSIPFGATGLFFILRYLYFVIIGESAGHVQSVSLGGTLLILSVLLFLLGLIGDAIRANRKTMEEILINLRDEKRFDQGSDEFLGYQVIKNFL